MKVTFSSYWERAESVSIYAYTDSETSQKEERYAGCRRGIFHCGFFPKPDAEGLKTKVYCILPVNFLNTLLEHL